MLCRREVGGGDGILRDVRGGLVFPRPGGRRGRAFGGRHKLKSTCRPHKQKEVLESSASLEARMLMDGS